MSKIKVKEDQNVPLAIVEQMLTLATSGFGLVAALAWNEVVKETVNNYIKPYISKDSGLISLTIYAFIVTTLAVIVTLQLTKLKTRIVSELKPSKRSK